MGRQLAALREVLEPDAGVCGREKCIGAITGQAMVTIIRGTGPMSVALKNRLEQPGKPLCRPRKAQTGLGIVTGLAPRCLGAVTFDAVATRGFKTADRLGGLVKESAKTASRYVSLRCSEPRAKGDRFENAMIRLRGPADATAREGPGADVITTRRSFARGQSRAASCR